MGRLLEVYNNEMKVGQIEVHSFGKRETFHFSYDKEWIKYGYQIDPALALSTTQYVATQLWGAFCDIGPDRWGRLIQRRKANAELTDSQYMIGVSDYYRSGALRIKENNKFITATADAPKLTSIEALHESTKRIEKGESLEEDLRNLLAPAGSLGGARPKASIVKDSELYIIKFPSIRDEYRQVTKCEQTMLEVAKIAKIDVCETSLYETKKGTALLVKRFDRIGDKRIPFQSGMTMLGARDGESGSSKSYVDLAFLLKSQDKKELYRRMLFNGLFGNTDDHLRNHGVLYNEQSKEWSLSPAFDVTPDSAPYSKQNHALNFVDYRNLPSLELFSEIKEFFDVDEVEFKDMLIDMKNARDMFEKVARKNKINSDNLKLLKNNYEHEDFERIDSFLSNTTQKRKYAKCC